MVDLYNKQVVDRGEFLGNTFNDEMLKDTHKVVRDPKNPRIAVIRTSDRLTFKNCRRRWGWSSHLRHNLGPKYGIGPLWFGTGMHFALEDFHGYNKFKHPKLAFEAFVAAAKKHAPHKVPDDVDELVTLGQGMMDYYILWLQQRKHSLLKTYWYDGVPQVEVNFKIEIPGDFTKYGFDKVLYSGTIDRMCIDDYDMLWPLDYKSAKTVQVLHFLSDPQVGAYMWAAPYLYDLPIAGFLYQQHRKDIPKPGRILQSGHVSTDKSQATTHLMYRETLKVVYGGVEKAPEGCLEMLNMLARNENEWMDSFVRIDRIYRNQHSAMSEGTKILMEIEDMLNPELALYPNPVRDCANMCPFYSPCVSMDDGSDWKSQIEMGFEPREAQYDGWRERIVWPEQQAVIDAVAAQKSDDSWINIDDD